MNTLSATITATASSEHLSILTVAVGEDNFHLLLVEQCRESIGETLKLVFKETEVILSNLSIPTTANTHSAIVQRIERGVVLSQITLLYHTFTLTALVPTLTFEPLDIAEGDTVNWMVQPSEISLLRETHGI